MRASTSVIISCRRRILVRHLIELMNKEPRWYRDLEGPTGAKIAVMGRRFQNIVTAIVSLTVVKWSVVGISAVEAAMWEATVDYVGDTVPCSLGVCIVI
jgi:hypothetical protein